MEIENLSIEGITVEYFPNSIDPVRSGKIWISFIYKWWQWTRYKWFKCAHDSYIKEIIWIRSISVLYVNSMGIHQWLWKAIYVYFGYILNDCAIILIWYYNGFKINATGHGNNVVDRLNVTDTRYWKGEMELIGKLETNDTSNIGITPSVSEDVSIKISDQCIHIY